MAVQHEQVSRTSTDRAAGDVLFDIGSELHVMEENRRQAWTLAPSAEALPQDVPTAVIDAVREHALGHHGHCRHTSWASYNRRALSDGTGRVCSEFTTTDTTRWHPERETHRIHVMTDLDRGKTWVRARMGIQTPMGRTTVAGNGFEVLRKAGISVTELIEDVKFGYFGNITDEDVGHNLEKIDRGLGAVNALRLFLREGKVITVSSLSWVDALVTRMSVKVQDAAEVAAVFGGGDLTGVPKPGTWGRAR